MSSENSVFQNHENQTSNTLNDILDLLSHIPNTTHIVNNINHLNEICVPMVGAKSELTGYNTHSNGITGFVPAPLMEDSGKFLRGDGTWQTVVTSIDPLRSAEIQTCISGQDTQAYPYLQSQPDCKNDTVPVLKYNKCLSFGRSNKNVSGSSFTQYTSLEMQTDGSDCADVLIAFKTKDTGRSNFLFGNLANVPNGSSVCVKMPTTSGMLLTDNGFTALKKSTFNDGMDVRGLATFINGANVEGDLIVNPLTSTPTIQLGTWTIQTTSPNYISLISKPDGAAVITNHLSLKNDDWVTHHPIRSSKFVLDAFMSSSSTGNKSDRYVISTDTAGNISNVTGVSGAAIAFSNGTGLVNLLHGPNSSFYVDVLNIEPRYNGGSGSAEGGEIHLSARQDANGNSQSYGSIFIDNYFGRCRIGNLSDTRYIVSIDPKGQYIDATSFEVRTKFIKIGQATAINYNGAQVDFSQPVTCTAESPVGDNRRYYRPIHISKNSPGTNSGANGDIWIQYT